jgi:hypothetical protein
LANGGYILAIHHFARQAPMDHSRRSFLKTSAVATAGLAAAQGFAHASGSDTDTAKIVEPINTEISAPGDIPLLVASFWTPEGDYVDPSERVLSGHPAIERDSADLEWLIQTVSAQAWFRMEHLC